MLEALILFFVLASPKLAYANPVEHNDHNQYRNISIDGNYCSVENSDFQDLIGRTLMTQVILDRLTIRINPETGESIYSSHCRTAPYGCESRVSTLVDYIYDSAMRENIDPWLLAAVAWHESGFNPYAISRIGAAGIFQINPRTRWARGLRFIHHHWYRQRCRRQLGACQELIVERAVRLLRRNIDNCGNIRSGLGEYNTGRCGGNRRYSRIVLRLQHEFLNKSVELLDLDI